MGACMDFAVGHIEIDAVIHHSAPILKIAPHILIEPGNYMVMDNILSHNQNRHALP